jgi:hypothetical protein
MKIKDNILAAEGYTSAEDLLTDVILLNSLSKKEQYKAEIENFEHKYKMSFEEFESQLHREKGVEDFRKEEDLEDWQFAINALKWWTKKAEDLKVA